MILFDFRCKDCTYMFERLTKGDEAPQCPECGGPTTRLIATPTISLEGLSGHFPTAADKWAKKHEDEAKRHSKSDNSGF
jgi:putative FmdB family regulatory protein